MPHVKIKNRPELNTRAKTIRKKQSGSFVTRRGTEILHDTKGTSNEEKLTGRHENLKYLCIRRRQRRSRSPRGGGGLPREAPCGRGRDPVRLSEPTARTASRDPPPLPLRFGANLKLF